ncbi:MAG: mandelate racemase/muconate lactonizing enzyme family protein [Thermoplasmatota archaeon]
MWEVEPYRIPLVRPYRWAKGAQAERLGLLIRFTEGGLTGWGETAPPPHEQDGIAALADEARRWAARVRGKPEEDLAAAPPRLRHGLLSAWLDCHAKRAGLPLASFMAERYATHPPAARVAVNALVEAVAPKEAALRARAAEAAGFRTVKLKSDGHEGHDVELVASVREAASVRLRLDANESWRPEGARRHLEALAPFGIEYVEQPFRVGRVSELRNAIEESPIPIALDESVTDAKAVEPYLGLQRRPILILKPQRLGGADRTCALMAWAYGEGCRTVVTNSLEAAVGRTHALHLAALLPEPEECGLATGGHLARDVAVAPEPVAGWMTLPTAAGLGIVRGS